MQILQIIANIADIANVETVIINGKIKVENGMAIMEPREKLSLPENF